ncbi:acetate kinase [Leifsonia xyli subsp. xyli]|uniref:Acetate kinase n=2 Tax=Leifsonia xyli subsp. xyli TaxID=59736 RepID=ACKA_LEIXX|nr:acetate kinase [Leifsonia xyli]Q6AGY7.1 RecName: Full=Acetate kinase; AltName: Full=Acetokinase [Leifsonia xyli subsp. xyli str. CTCB07]AAT88358.1 acetate kinase [Leifsonia xyli subsp. xyli str. CTCB07]ODA89791.1 acetate kinase [Leifsonia xyli subsp. xyli]
MSAVLVVNSGSSSLKYQLIDAKSEEALATGLIERVGEGEGRIRHRGPGGSAEYTLVIPDHTAAFRAMLAAFGTDGSSLVEHPLDAVGHRVVHGGKRFFEPTIVTPLVEANIDDLADLAPLHNPANLDGIRAARQAFPAVPHVAVFDTAFHQTLEPAAYTYAIDAALAEEHRVRRYGFHGTSHKYVSGAVAELLGRPLGELKQIVLHLGNGASACAVDGGRSIDTSMGMTPLEGLVMGTRSGDIDPAVLFHLSRRAGLGIDELDELLNRRSGLLGLTGHGDMRDVRRVAESGDAVARLALDTVAHRLKHYIGAYTALLGGLDALTFTAGVGENDPDLRAAACKGLGVLGIQLDPERNAARSPGARIVSADGSPVTVLVVPTNEELEIARQALQAVAAG